MIHLNEEGWEETGWGKGEVTHLNDYQIGSFTYEFGTKREIMDGDINLELINI